MGSLGFWGEASGQREERDGAERRPEEAKRAMMRKEHIEAASSHSFPLFTETSAPPPPPDLAIIAINSYYSY